MAIKAAKRGARRGTRPRALVIRATIRHISPEIWRRIEVPDRYTLEQLHRVLQVAFSWLDYHLHAFHFGERAFRGGDEEWDGEFTSQVSLRDLAFAKGATLWYNYDFGDDWEVDLMVESAVDCDDLMEPRVLAGKRAAPPEDSGGPHGYASLLVSLANPTPDNAEHRWWAGDGFDPERFDPRQADSAVRVLAGWGAI